MTTEERLQQYYKEQGADEYGNLGPGVKVPCPPFVIMPTAIPVPPVRPKPDVFRIG